MKNSNGEEIAIEVGYGKKSIAITEKSLNIFLSGMLTGMAVAGVAWWRLLG